MNKYNNINNNKKNKNTNGNGNNDDTVSFLMTKMTLTLSCIEIMLQERT